MGAEERKAHALNQYPTPTLHTHRECSGATCGSEKVEPAPRRGPAPGSGSTKGRAAAAGACRPGCRRPLGTVTRPGSRVAPGSAPALTAGKVARSPPPRIGLRNSTPRSAARSSGQRLQGPLHLGCPWPGAPQPIPPPPGFLLLLGFAWALEVLMPSGQPHPACPCPVNPCCVPH